MAASWFKVSDRFFSCPEAITAGPSAVGLWVQAGSWSACYGPYLPTSGASAYEVPRRAAISPDVRREVYERDGFTCVECLTDADLTLDHIFPWSLGGSDDPSNLRTLCRPCNSRKGARV